MANRFSAFLKKKLLGKDQNLVSLEYPYEIIARLLKDAGVCRVVDAGASNGHISRRLSKIFPSADIHAFEPNSMYQATLEEYAKADSRFHPYFTALSDHAGTEKLYITESAGNTSLLSPGAGLKEISPEGSKIKNIVDIPVTSLDIWAEQNNIDSVELMKFDIQGGELKALCGAAGLLENTTVAVYTEVWFNSTYEQGAMFGQIDAMLHGRGFVLYDLYQPKYGPGNVIMWANALYIKPKKLGL